MRGFQTADACRSCGAAGLPVLLDLGRQPLANALLTEADLDRPEPAYPLELALCPGCSLAQITVTVPPEEMFSDYAYFSSFSPTVVAGAQALVERLVPERCLGPGHLAMEIASNDGYLLRHYLRAGVPVLGVDPAANVVEAARANGVPTLCAFFGAEVAEQLRSEGRQASVLHANNVMAHVPDPNGVVAGMGRVLADDGVAVIETPYLRDLVEKLEFDTIYHEHLFYYSLTSFSALLARNGLAVADVERIPIHGGSLRIFAVLDGAAAPTPAVVQLLDEESRIGMDGPSFYEGFAERVRTLCATLRAMLAEVKAEGRRVAGYGAAAKATVLTNAAGITGDTIDFVADRSPHKQGRYVPGARIPILPVERLVEEMPDDVLLFAWNFADEILAQQTEYRQRGGRFIVPVPEPHFA